MSGSGIFNSLFNRPIRRESDRGLNTSLSDKNERNLANSSFHSFHTSLNRSFSDAGDIDFHNEVMSLQSNTNIVSVLNTPKRVHLHFPKLFCKSITLEHVP